MNNVRELHRRFAQVRVKRAVTYNRVPEDFPMQKMFILFCIVLCVMLALLFFLSIFIQTTPRDNEVAMIAANAVWAGFALFAAQKLTKRLFSM